MLQPISIVQVYLLVSNNYYLLVSSLLQLDASTILRLFSEYSSLNAVTENSLQNANRISVPAETFTLLTF